MKRKVPQISWCLLAGLFLSGYSLIWGQRAEGAKEVKADELKQKLDKGEKLLIIDVREDEEVKSGSLPGAIHIPLGVLEKRMKDIPKDVQLAFT